MNVNPDKAIQQGITAQNYKGVYYGEDAEQMLFEGGAHFSHQQLCHKLEEIILTLSPERRGSSIYDTPNLSHIISDSNTKAETRKIASDNSKEMIKKEKAQAKTQNPQQRNKCAVNFATGNLSVVKQNKTGSTIKSIKESNYKKIQPKPLLYHSNIKSNEKASAVKLQVNKETSATKLITKANKCIIDLNINGKKNLNQTLKTQKSSSICSTTKAQSDVMYKITKNQTSNKIINLELTKKINLNSQFNANTVTHTNSNINTTNNNDQDNSKIHKEKDKKKIISAFNSLLSVTNIKSRNQQQPKKNSLENKTAENAPNKIFSSNQPKLEPNKTKESNKAEEQHIISNKLASRNKNILDEKSRLSKAEQPSKYIQVGTIEVKKVFSISKSKLNKPAKIDTFEQQNSTKNMSKNTFNTSKKIESSIMKNPSASGSGPNKIIKITTSSITAGTTSASTSNKGDGKLQSNFLNFSKNLPVGKKV